MTSTIGLSEAGAAMLPFFASKTGLRPTVRACRKLVSFVAESFRPQVGRHVWRRSAAAAMLFPWGDTLLSHHRKWSGKTVEAYHVNEQRSETERIRCIRGSRVGGVTSRNRMRRTGEFPAIHRTAACGDTSIGGAGPPTGCANACRIWDVAGCHRLTEIVACVAATLAHLLAPRSPLRDLWQHLGAHGTCRTKGGWLPGDIVTSTAPTTHRVAVCGVETLCSLWSALCGHRFVLKGRAVDSSLFVNCRGCQGCKEVRWRSGRTQFGAAAVCNWSKSVLIANFHFFCFVFPSHSTQKGTLAPPQCAENGLGLGRLTHGALWHTNGWLHARRASL